MLAGLLATFPVHVLFLLEPVCQTTGICLILYIAVNVPVFMFPGNSGFQVQHGFIARATEQGETLLSAYKDLVKIYPDRKKNFEVNIAKVSEFERHKTVSRLSRHDSRRVILVAFELGGT